MWPSSWECLSPDTCVRCANVTDDTCLYNKFTCLCNYNDGQNTPCVHQEILNVHKSKFNNVTDSSINISVPGTSGISSFKANDKRRPRRKKKEKLEPKYVEAYTSADYLDGSVSETANLLPAENYLSPDITDVNEPESAPQFALAFLKDQCDSDFFVDTEIPDESYSSDSTSSSTSSSSSSSSSSDSLSNGSSCDSDQNKVTDSQTNKGYKIMGVSKDCDNSDCDVEDSESSSSSSSSNDSADSTSVSSDNSWWQEYEQLKEIQFFKKTETTKDSGYVSTTSPNDSNKTDE